ncbi:uncharacterized protein RCO7_15181 [Rhynchosporium graminicola]|uniref:Uncharacterized protein n=1 Tax=Rhynchosporium graminicola TaxID=2792576 RepID=A0A1E1LPH5_9HELO|nr:uncharacterized protein RCO7_15181 [Rhynchosporium commune]
MAQQRSMFRDECRTGALVGFQHRCMEQDDQQSRGNGPGIIAPARSAAMSTPIYLTNNNRYGALSREQSSGDDEMMFKGRQNF